MSDISDKLITAQSTYKGTCYVNIQVNAALKFYQINEHDLDKGLSHLKSVVKHRFREIAPRIHPDTYMNYKPAGYKGSWQCTGNTINLALRYFRLIQSLEYMPMTWDNMEVLLELQKGYKTVGDM